MAEFGTYSPSHMLRIDKNSGNVGIGRPAMNVYILRDQDRGIQGVFGSREGAEQAIRDRAADGNVETAEELEAYVDAYEILQQTVDFGPMPPSGTINIGIGTTQPHFEKSSPEESHP